MRVDRKLNLSMWAFQIRNEDRAMNVEHALFVEVGVGANKIVMTLIQLAWVRVETSVSLLFAHRGAWVNQHIGALAFLALCEMDRTVNQ